MSNLILVAASILSFTMCTPKSSNTETSVKADSKEITEKKDYQNMTSSVFASGCFWCVEAVFESVEGVSEAVSGYAGGKASTANYQMVSAGRTKHAEAVEVFYDPNIVSYETLLIVFFGSHDPTTLNRQGPDRGTQYRSTIFYKNEDEKAAAEKYIAQLEKDEVFDGPITTTLEPLTEFYDAEDYHQNYEERNPNQPYVRSVSIPRLNRFKSKYPQLLKKDKVKH